MATFICRCRLWLLSLCRNRVAATETTWLAEPKIFILWPFIGKVCHLLALGKKRTPKQIRTGVFKNKNLAFPNDY